MSRTVAVITRHSKDCPDAGRGTKWAQCNCRKSLLIYDTETRKNTRVSAKTRSWEVAEKLAQTYSDESAPALLPEIKLISGVYLLDRPGLYVGESSNIHTRLLAHRKRYSSARMVLLMEIADDSRERQKFERLFIITAQKLGWTLANKNKVSPSTVGVDAELAERLHRAERILCPDQAADRRQRKQEAWARARLYRNPYKVPEVIRQQLGF